jgi:hypothetical protein
MHRTNDVGTKGVYNCYKRLNTLFMKKILFVLSTLVLLAAACNTTKPTSELDKPISTPNSNSQQNPTATSSPSGGGAHAVECKGIYINKQYGFSFACPKGSMILVGDEDNVDQQVTNDLTKETTDSLGQHIIVYTAGGFLIQWSVDDRIPQTGRNYPGYQECKYRFTDAKPINFSGTLGYEGGSGPKSIGICVDKPKADITIWGQGSQDNDPTLVNVFKTLKFTNKYN